MILHSLPSLIDPICVIIPSRRQTKSMPCHWRALHQRVSHYLLLTRSCSWGWSCTSAEVSLSTACVCREWLESWELNVNESVRKNHAALNIDIVFLYRSMTVHSTFKHTMQKLFLYITLFPIMLLNTLTTHLTANIVISVQWSVQCRWQLVHLHIFWWIALRNILINKLTVMQA